MLVFQSWYQHHSLQGYVITAAKAREKDKATADQKRESERHQIDTCRFADHGTVLSEGVSVETAVATLH